jgi:hypothetical protein
MLRKACMSLILLWVCAVSYADTGAHAFDLSNFKPIIVTFANLDKERDYQLQCWVLSPSKPVNIAITAGKTVNDQLIPSDTDFVMTTKIFSPLSPDPAGEIHYALSSERGRGFCELTVLYA